MVCSRIQALEYPSGVPSFMFENGALFLDEGKDFAIRQTRKAEELNEFGKITVGASLGISLPYTTKNYMILGKFVNPNVHDFNFKPLKVIAYSSSNAITHSLLYVIRHDEKNDSFECELRDDDSHWVIGSKKVKLKDLDFDIFEFTKENVVANWPLSTYTDGDPGIYFPLVYYGAWKEKGYASLEDFRPWYSVYYLLKKGFAKAGWVFKSPIFDTHPIGKKLWTYLIAPIEQEKQQQERPGVFSATTNNEIVLTDNKQTITKVIFEHEDYDKNNVYDINTGEFASSGIYDFNFLVSFKTTLDADTFSIDFLARVIKESGAQKQTLFITAGTKGPIYPDKNIINISGYLKDVVLNIADKVYIEVITPGKGEILWYGYFNNANTGYFNQEGFKYKPNQYISSDYRLYDLLLGIFHIFRFKIHTDHHRREVHLFPNYKVKWYDTEVEGYYLDEDVQLKDWQINESSVVSSQKQDQKRYFRLQYKKSTDARIQGLNYPEDHPIFSKTFDLGEYFENDIEVSENPFFEPTINDKVFSIRPNIIDPSNEYHIDIPFLVDNDQDLPSFNIAPRIMIAHGFQAYEGFDGQSMAWKWYNTTQTNVPYMSMLPNYKLPGGVEIKESLVYGDHKEDLFSRFWKRWVFDNLVNLRVNILAYLSPKQFFDYSFRKAYHIISNGKSVYGRILGINDFDGCGNTTTPIDILPSTGNTKAPVLEPRSNDEFCSGQNPILNVSKSGNTYTASADLSLITDTVISTLIEWRYFDSSSWNTGNVVSNPTKPFIFRLTVDLQKCGKKYRTKYINPCDNKPVIRWTNAHRDPSDQSKWCITAVIDGLLNDPILSSTFTISKDNGTPVSYTIGTEVCALVAKISISGTIQFDNTCPPVPVTGTYTFPPTPINCADNKPTVVCIPVGNGLFTFAKSGTWASKLLIYFIQYRHVGDDDNSWIRWDHDIPAPVPGTVEARGVFFWEDTCPPVHTPIVTCAEPSPNIPLFQNDIESQIPKAMSFKWDFSKLPDTITIDPETKTKVKESDYVISQLKKYAGLGDGYALMRIHNQYNLSDYEYCCGNDADYALRHVKNAIDNGDI